MNSIIFSGKLLIVVIICSCTGILCTKKSAFSPAELLFDPIPETHQLNPILKEVSGIADSKRNPGYLWGEQDGGNPTQLALINYDGTVTKQIYLKGIQNVDWEDLGLYNDSLYLADIGDNNSVRSQCSFYVFAEPDVSTDTVYAFRKIDFQYPDGAHDAEAFLIDRNSKDIFIITKRDQPSLVYQLKYPYSSGVNMLLKVGKLDYTGVVSAASSITDKEIIIKTYDKLNYYIRDAGQSIMECLTNTPVLLPYIKEPQGEAVCFSQKSDGYFTLSEQGLSPLVNLYFYKRK